MQRKVAIVSGLAIFATAFIAYVFADRIGFYAHDWHEIETVMKSDGLSYVLNCSQIDGVYYGCLRLARKVFVLLEYAMFGVNPAGYHIVHVLIHALNAILLARILWRITRRARIALIAGLFFVSFPVISEAVLWISAEDNLMTLIYLLAVSFWLTYLQSKSRRHYWLTMGAFALSVLTKELALTLPLTLFLLDWFLSKRIELNVALVKRYVWFFALSFIFALVISFFLPKSNLALIYGNSLGIHNLENAIRYLQLLVLPWNLDIPYRDMWATLIALILIIGAARQWGALTAFLVIAAIANFLPVVGFQTYMFNPRYLYLSGAAMAVALALLIEKGAQIFNQRGLGALFASSVTVAVLVVNVNGVWEHSLWLADISRAQRTPFRDISQQHPSFPPDTYLYFINPPTSVPQLSAMFFVKYRDNVKVDGTDNVRPAGLREQSIAYVYYFDEQKRTREQRVDARSIIVNSPTPPIDFSIPIQLSGYEIASATLTRGETVVLLLYWKATAPIEKDYTVFAHLVNAPGETVAGSDNQPRGGKKPTSSWQVGETIVDWVIIPITPEIPRGKDYRLEIGWYYLPTLERAVVLDAEGNPIADKVFIAPIEIRDDP